MVDNAQMEMFVNLTDFDKSNQTYLGKQTQKDIFVNKHKENNKQRNANILSADNNFVSRPSPGWTALWHPEMGGSGRWTLHVSFTNISLKFYKHFT